MEQANFDRDKLTSNQRCFLIACAGTAVMAVIVGVCYAVPKVVSQIMGCK